MIYKKSFKPCNEIRFFARPCLIALLLFGFCSSAWLAYYFLFLQFSVGYFILSLAYIALCCWATQRFYHEFWELMWASVTVGETEIVWRCPLRRTRVMEVSDCMIGIGKETSGWNMTYPYIYFSKRPLPAEAADQIQKVPTSDAFIKFRYRSDFAEYLLKHLPREKTSAVAYYYECEKRTQRKQRRKN